MGIKTGYVAVPLDWYLDVFIIHGENLAWRTAAKPCLEAR